MQKSPSFNDGLFINLIFLNEDRYIKYIDKKDAIRNRYCLLQQAD
jgi:hypothetical protein